MSALKFLIGATALGMTLTACSQNSNPAQISAQEIELATPVLTVITQQYCKLSLTTKIYVSNWPQMLYLYQSHPL